LTVKPVADLGVEVGRNVDTLRIKATTTPRSAGGRGSKIGAKEGEREGHGQARL
jgi:hypothetical protein